MAITPCKLFLFWCILCFFFAWRDVSISPPIISHVH
jgi:hypothetical protein